MLGRGWVLSNGCARKFIYLLLFCCVGVCVVGCAGGWEDVAIWKCLSSFVLYVVVTCKYYFTVASSSFIFSGLIKILQGYMLACVTVLPFVGITYLLKKCVDCISLLYFVLPLMHCNTLLFATLILQMLAFEHNKLD